MKINIKNFEFIVKSDEDFWNNINNWEKESFDILDKFLNNGNIFIDVGAWNGVLSMYGSKISQKVYSFEPDKIAYERLIDNVINNNLLNVVCSNNGINNIDGISKFHIIHYGDSSSSLIDRDMDQYKTNEIVEIKTIKLSKFLIDTNINNIGLIKIDTEGGEIYILDEMEEYIKNNRPTMFISFHPNWFPNKDFNINKIANMLNIYYNIFDVNLNKISKEIFVSCLNGTEHCFLFINKTEKYESSNNNSNI